jgi:hypothetical protein
LLRSGGVSLVSGVCSTVFGFIFITWKLCNKTRGIVLDKDGVTVMNERKEK